MSDQFVYESAVYESAEQALLDCKRLWETIALVDATIGTKDKLADLIFDRHVYCGCPACEYAKQETNDEFTRCAACPLFDHSAGQLFACERREDSPYRAWRLTGDMQFDDMRKQRRINAKKMVELCDDKLEKIERERKMAQAETKVRTALTEAGIRLTSKALFEVKIDHDWYGIEL